MTPQAVWVSLGMMAVAALAVIVYLVLSLVGKADRKAEPWTGNALYLLYWTFSPVWLVTLVLIGIHLWALLTTLPDALEQPAELRTYAAAFGGLIAALGAVLAVPFALIRVYTTERQTRTAEQGHITDRITKAIEQLGAERTVKTPGKDAHGNDTTTETTVPDIVVRIGSIYAMERIADDSPRDQIRVLELLNDYLYVRNGDRDTIDLKNSDGTPISPKDMAVIAKILARNNWNRL